MRQLLTHPNLTAVTTARRSSILNGATSPPKFRRLLPQATRAVSAGLDWPGIIGLLLVALP